VHCSRVRVTLQATQERMAFWWISITSRDRRQSVDYLNFSLCDWCWLLLAIVGNVSQGLFIIIIVISLCARYRRPLNRPARTHNICPRTKSCATGTPLFYIFIYHFIIIIGRSSFLLADRWVTDACLVCALSQLFIFFLSRTWSTGTTSLPLERSRSVADSFHIYYQIFLQFINWIGNHSSCAYSAVPYTYWSWQRVVAHTEYWIMYEVNHAEAPDRQFFFTRGSSRVRSERLINGFYRRAR